MYGSIEYLYSLRMIVVFQLYYSGIYVNHCRCFVLHEEGFLKKMDVSILYQQMICRCSQTSVDFCYLQIQNVISKE